MTGSDETVAVVRDAVAEQGVLPFTLDDRRLVAVHVKGQASSLDDITVAGGAEIGSVAVFQPIADGRELTLTRDGKQFTDAETGSIWNILGEAVDGQLKGEKLRAQEFTDTFWFAWAAFQPDTRVVARRGRRRRPHCSQPAVRE